MLVILYFVVYFAIIAFFARLGYLKIGLAWTDVVAMCVMILPFWLGIFSGFLETLSSIIGCLFIWHNIRWFEDDARVVEIMMYISVIFIIILSICA